jgi:nickel-type superoxide dismutase maturation protease
MKPPVSRFTVQGNSMLPTLTPGQDILSFNWAYIGRKPKIGEVIVLNLAGKDMVKRVVRIEDGEIFVEGDNTDESTDSRDFGAVSVEDVIGKVVYGPKDIPCPNCSSAVVGIYGRKDAICQNCGFKLTCCGEP